MFWSEGLTLLDLCHLFRAIKLWPQQRYWIPIIHHVLVVWQLSRSWRSRHKSGNRVKLGLVLIQTHFTSFQGNAVFSRVLLLRKEGTWSWLGVVQRPDFVRFWEGAVQWVQGEGLEPVFLPCTPSHLPRPSTSSHALHTPSLQRLRPPDPSFYILSVWSIIQLYSVGKRHLGQGVGPTGPCVFLEHHLGFK